MYQTLFFTIIISIPTLLFGQNKISIVANLDTIREKVHYDVMGVNTERMFYRSLDANGKIPDEILDDIIEAEDLIYRWPGGATANFYHYFNGTAKGYGLQRTEIESVEHPMKCDLPKNNPNCMTYEQYAPKNYIYNLMEYADIYQEKFKKKKRVVWLPNIFTFYLNNKNEIPVLDQISSLEEAEQFKNEGKISEDFFMRIKDVIDVYDLLRNYPSIELEAIEYGNELYYHIPATGVRYNQVNNPVLWLFNEKKYRKTINEHISLYRSIVQFFNKALFVRGPKIATAAPVGLITFTGSQPNMNLVWNEGIRDSILPMVDGVIHHFYFKSSGPMIDPKTAEDVINIDSLLKIKTIADEFIHVRIPKVDTEFEKFFKLTEQGKKMWMTEFNTDNGYFDGYYALWQNTFFHSYYQFEAFISFIDNTNNTDVIKYAFPHLWLSHPGDYNYGAYASLVNPNGSYKKVKRTTYSTYSILGALSKKDIHKINATVSNEKNLERYDLFTKVYFEPNPDTNDTKIGNLIIVYSNKSGQNIQFNPEESLTLYIKDSSLLKIDNGNIEYLSAPNIYSSNGYTFNDTVGNDNYEDVFIEKFDNVESNSTFVIPGYSLGYLSFPVIDEEKVPTSITDKYNNDLFSIYPNPSSSILNVHLNKETYKTGASKWVIIDALGKEISTKVNIQNPNILQIDISHLPVGTYQLMVSQENLQKTSQFIKQ
ncbi:MAG: T9SS type A sorting domain-containing protein [Chitinophagales bacterium]|nr:T9SS type A sorting domain-containing protein [Chitinophagales bacterium]